MFGILRFIVIYFCQWVGGADCILRGLIQPPPPEIYMIVPLVVHLYFIHIAIVFYNLFHMILLNGFNFPGQEVREKPFTRVAALLFSCRSTGHMTVTLLLK